MKNSKKQLVIILSVMVLGYLVGLVAGPAVIPFFDPIGTIFVRLITVLVVPLVFSSIASGIAGMSDIKETGRVGVKIASLYILTSVVACFIGTILATVIRPGNGFELQAGAEGLAPREVGSLVDNIINMFPKNIFDAAVNMSMVQIIVFALLFGISLVMLGEKKASVLNILDVVTAAMTTMTGLVMKMAPLGIFSLMTVTGAKYGLSVLLPLGKFFGTEYLAMFLQILLVYVPILIVFGKVNPIEYFKRIGSILSMTLSTTSSNATLPVTMQVCEERLGVPREIGSFTLPLGATVNLDGTALNVPIIVLFTAQIYGITFTPGELLTLLFSTIVISIGAAGIPSGLTPFIIALLAQYELPTEAYGIILASYRLLDMGLTSMNVLGDTVCTVGVSNWEGALNRKLWDKKVH